MASRSRWEVFPQRRWPRDFGLRPRERAIVYVDPRQLELSDELVLPAEPSHQERARANLRAVFERSGWSQYSFAGAVLGCHERTLQRYLAGGHIPEDRAVWLNRLEAVALHRKHVIIMVRWETPIVRLAAVARRKKR